MTEMEDEKKKLGLQKESAIKEGNFEEASKIQKKQQELKKKIESTRKRFDKKMASSNPEVSVEDIAAIVSSWSKIPVQKLQQETDAHRLQIILEETLHQKSGRTGRSSQRSRAGSEARTCGIERARIVRLVHFLFLGPTGVGKTELIQGIWQRHCLEEKTQ